MMELLNEMLLLTAIVKCNCNGQGSLWLYLKDYLLVISKVLRRKMAILKALLKITMLVNMIKRFNRADNCVQAMLKRPSYKWLMFLKKNVYLKCIYMVDIHNPVWGGLSTF